MPKPSGFKARRNHRNRVETAAKPPETMPKPSSFPLPETTETSAYKHWFGFGWVGLWKGATCNSMSLRSLIGKNGPKVTQIHRYKRNDRLSPIAAKRLSLLGNRRTATLSRYDLSLLV
jgi:hypothetical protein